MRSIGNRVDPQAPGSAAYPPSVAIPALLALCSGVLGMLHVATRALVIAMPASQFFKSLENLFHLDREANVPTWFTTSLWIGAALLAMRLRRMIPVDGRPWAVIAGICVLLSLDETIGVHESLGNAFAWIGPAVLPGSLQFVYIWTIFGAAFAIVIAVGLLRFVLRQPRHAAVAILVAGGMFVSGAIGIELVSAAFDAGVLEPDGELDWIAVVLVEEIMEMGGIIVFIHALLWLAEFTDAGVMASFRDPA
jgi:hypothetical protein